MNREPVPLHFALRSDDGVEVGILGADIVVLARMLQESCPPWLQEVLRVVERRSPGSTGQ